MEAKINITDTKSKNIKLYQNIKLVDKYAKEYNLPKNEAIKHFEALKEFLLLCSTTKTTCIPSTNLDKIWHTFILFTRDYDIFCKSYLGRFIHHEPADNFFEGSSKSVYYCRLDANSKGKLSVISVSNSAQLKTEVEYDCYGGADCGSS